LSLEEDRATATGNMYRKFGENWTLVFEISKRTDRQTDKQTNRHTDTLIAGVRTYVWGKVKFLN